MSQPENREIIEWCSIRWNNAPDDKLPRVLLIGDSIANSYAGAVQDLLKGWANVDLLATSKNIADGAFLAETAYVMQGYAHAVIHFNNGLHGEHLTELDYQVALREYVAKLRTLAPTAALVWASSTPVTTTQAGYPLDEHRNGRVIRRNALAAVAMAEQRIPVNDLYSLVVGRTELCAGDTVHYNAQGAAALAKAVAEAIRPHIRA